MLRSFQLVCLAAWWLAACGHPAQQKPTCPAGADYLAPTVGSEPTCLTRCSGNASCAGGTTCSAIATSEQTYCRPGCSKDTDCAAGQFCDQGTFVCRQRDPAGGGFNAPCDAASDCPNLPNPVCYRATDGFPSGMCTTTCDPYTPCPNGGVCLPFSVDGSGRCFSACTADTDCRAGFNCNAIETLGRACVPACTSWNTCHTDEHCDTGSGRCIPVRTVGGGHAGQLRTIPLGTVTASPSGSSTVRFTVQPDMISATLVAMPDQLPATNAIVSVNTLSGPSGKFYDLTTNGYWPFDNYANQYGAFAALLPNTPQISLEPGNYEATFYADSTRKLTVSLIEKTANASPTGGTIDVNLWFATSKTTAADAQNDPSFQAVLAEVRRRWAIIGLAIGELHYYDVPNGMAYRNMTDSDIGDLCESTASATNDGLNWFFVDSITTSSQWGTTLGVAAGIPGIPLRGARTSGVIVSLVDWPGSASQLASTMVHEGGHWLGLFHPSERDGHTFDPLPDTPECSIERDRNGNGMVEAWECFYLDGDETMFWLADESGQPQDQWSDDQQFVMLRHPAVY